MMFRWLLSLFSQSDKTIDLNSFPQDTVEIVSQIAYLLRNSTEEIDRYLDRPINFFDDTYVFGYYHGQSMVLADFFAKEKFGGEMCVVIMCESLSWIFNKDRISIMRQINELSKIKQSSFFTGANAGILIASVKLGIIPISADDPDLSRARYAAAKLGGADFHALTIAQLERIVWVDVVKRRFEL